MGMDAIIKTIVNSRAFLNGSPLTNKTIMTVIERAKEITERMIMMRMRTFCKLDCSGSPAQCTFEKNQINTKRISHKTTMNKRKKNLLKKKMNNNDSLLFHLTILPCILDAVLPKNVFDVFDVFHVCVMCMVCLICV
jgi:hypothetical protein